LNSIEIRTKICRIRADKGVALTAQGKHDEAIQAYNKAIQLNPQYVEAWNNKGIALAAQGNYDQLSKLIKRP
jgi:Flp pilus assembly protein TadD